MFAARRVYRLVLRLSLPPAGRDDAAEMEEVFAHCVDVARDRYGAFGALLALMRGVVDALAFAVSSRSNATAGLKPGGFTPAGLKACGYENNPRRFKMFRDVRSAVRAMKAQPGYSALIVLMLALGIGATAAIFSVVYGVLLRPLPFPDSDRIVQVWGSLPSRQMDRVSLTEANFWDMRDMNRAFEEFGAWHSASFTLTGSGEPQRVTAARVSAGFFKALGVRPVAGRLFEKGEDEAGAPAERVMLSHAFWSNRFAGDTTIAGRAITLDGRPYSVVGVLPAGSPWLDGAEIFVPFIRRGKANRGSWEYAGVARLREGVTFEAALDDLHRVARDLEATHKENQGLSATMAPAATWIASDDLRRTLWILLSAVGLLLVIACVNVTNLLLARASARAREAAIRSALGASRIDLVRERLTEALVHSLAGAGLGLLIAYGALQLLISLGPSGIPRLAEVSLNVWVFSFTAGIALLVGVVTGVIPALQAPVANVAPMLRHGQRGTVGDRRHDRLRSVFVGVQVAISLMLLVGAGLLVRSLGQVLSVERGFRTEQRLLVTVSVPSALGEERMAQTVSNILTRLEQLPDLHAVAAVSGVPLAGGSTGLGLDAADHPVPQGAPVPWANWRIVTKDYFKTMGLPLIAGRHFNEQDEIGKPWRVIISKRAADLLWPGQNAIGRTAILWKGQGENTAEVIGVVGDMRERGLEADPTIAVYIPAYGTLATRTLNLVMHTKGRPEDAASSVRAIVASVDPNLPVSNIRTLEDVVSTSVGTRRFTMLLLTTFAGLALVLAVAGVYGVLAYAIARRTTEIGVRLALGARPGRVLGRVFAKGMQPVIAGTVIGLALAFWLSRLMTSLLFGVTPRDPMTYVVGSLALIVTAAIACYLPARSVLRVDPATALRVE